jgi:uncharacterized repeat protein (TIGR01451 family)
VKRLIAKLLFVSIGMTALALALARYTSPAAYAISLAALTPTAEPSTRTPQRPTATPQPKAPATATLPPRPTVVPTEPPPINTPKPRPPGRDSRADPAVTKAASVSEARIGDIVDFTLTVTNHGSETADDVVVTDAMPDFLDVLEASSDKGAVANDGRTVVVTIGSVGSDDVITIRIRTRVNDRAQPPGGRNSVTLAASNNSDNPDNNVAGVELSIPAAAGPTTPATEVPTALPAGSPEPAPAATPPTVAPRPSQLPVTGAGEQSGAFWPLLLLGLAALGLSWLAHQRAKA